MDWWASLEHKIFYKFRGDPPPGLSQQLLDAASTAQHLDHTMEELHRQVRHNQ